MGFITLYMECPILFIMQAILINAVLFIVKFVLFINDSEYMVCMFHVFILRITLYVECFLMNCLTHAILIMQDDYYATFL